LIGNSSINRLAVSVVRRHVRGLALPACGPDAEAANSAAG
jgi:hypothetical protein